MNLMIERVGKFLDLHPEDDHELARNAIRSVQEPTEQMIRAGVCVLTERRAEGHKWTNSADCELIEAVFKAMVAEALR